MELVISLSIIAMILRFVFALGAWHERSKQALDAGTRAAMEGAVKEAREAVRMADTEIVSLRQRSDTQQAGLNKWKELYDRVVSERQKYEAVAKQHEVKWPVVIDKSEVAFTKVRQVTYRSTIDENLRALEKDLEPFKGQEITISLTVQGEIGFWRDQLANDLHKDSVYINGQRFTGPPERVCNEVVLFLSCASWVSHPKREVFVFIKDGSPGKPGTHRDWRAPINPVKFQIDIFTREPAASATKPQVILVPQLETKTEVSVIEIPVYKDREVVKEVVREPSPEEIEAIIAARVEVERLGHEGLAVGRKNTPVPKGESV